MIFAFSTGLDTLVLKGKRECGSKKEQIHPWKLLTQTNSLIPLVVFSGN